ncbi:hypothetical protein J1614_006151 [Plenodomus biglobosus]|nr:hypothetical protein J1614_006151 [Plenodomus biglobosus]
MPMFESSNEASIWIDQADLGFAILGHTTAGERSLPCQILLCKEELETTDNVGMFGYIEASRSRELMQSCHMKLVIIYDTGLDDLPSRYSSEMFG